MEDYTRHTITVLDRGFWWIYMTAAAVYFHECHGNNVTLTSESLDQLEYTNATLKCAYIGPYKGTFSWMLQNELILYARTDTNCQLQGLQSNSKLYSYSCQNSSLHSVTLINITQTRNGEEWKCSFTPGTITYESNSLKIFVKVPVRVSYIAPYSQILAIPENSTIVWQCKSSECRPKPMFRWFLESPYENSTAVLDKDPNEFASDVIQAFTSNYSLALNRSLNSWILSCGINNKNDTAFVLSEKIQMNVTYPPEGPPMIRNFDYENKVVSTVNVITGGFINLECSVSGGNPLPRLQWSINDDNPQTVSGILVTKNISFQATSIDVITELKCQSIHDLIDTSSVSVNVLYPPQTPVIKIKSTSGSYVQVNKTIDVIEGIPYTVNCSAKSNPQVSLFQWNDLPPTNKSTFYVEIADRGNAETITCNVSNVMQISVMRPTVTGTNITQLRVNVLYPPKVTILRDATTIEGEEIDYTCNFTEGNPSATNITWSWKGSLWDGPHLQLKNISRNQAGQYRCIVQNVMTGSDGSHELGKSNGTVNLSVQYKTKILKFIINDQEWNQVNLNENDTVNTSCKIEGDPFPTGELLHQKACCNLRQQNQPLTASQQSSYLRLSSVFQAHCSDTGVQICIGNNTLYNGWQSTSNKSISLFVNCSPRKHSSFPVTENVTSALNATASFHFTAMAYPPPNFQWHKIQNGVATSETVGGVIENASISTNVMQIKFTLEHVEESHYGEYLLNLTNQYGTFQQRFYLIPEAMETSTNTFTKSSSVGPAVGGAVGGLLAIVAVVVVVIMARKRLLGKQTHAESAICDFNDSHTYTNFSKEMVMNKSNGDDKALFLETQQTSMDSPKLPERMPLKLSAAHNLQELDDYDDKADERTYGNTYEMIKRIERIRVPELCPYLTNKTTDFFGMEFQNIPKGLTKPYEFSQKPENIALNRYNGIFPYDHSRVKIPDDPTYFINACYINGYKKKKAFIASLGPLARTTYNFVTFWQMVWSEMSDVIVMLTKLKEPSGVKCDQYWPETDTTQSYGEVIVESLGEEEYSDYVLRKFTVSKGNTKRKLMQFHFMAWPDKSVPEDVTCVLEFRKRVQANHSSGPMIVHCSAGIGRTGTLIAIEILIEEGQRERSVNVVECVKTMRDQRTSMVQTVDQYHYIYKALANALVFDCQSIALQKFPKYLDKTNTDQFNKMFQTFNQSVESDSTTESNARTANKMQRDRNRIGCDIPGDSHRVRLFLNRYEETSTDYINAVYVDSFKKNEHFIVAQSPMTDGVEDFLCMIYQVECSCIVSLGDSHHGRNVGMFIPTDDTKSFAIGCFKITCKVLDTKENYIIRKVKIEFKGKYAGGEKDVYHFEYNDWALGQKTPSDPHKFVAFTLEVEEFASQLGTGKSQVLVHCLNAFERSCLFCAVVTLVEKVKYEGEVCVPNTLRHIRARRKLAIPNMEQFQFCFKAVLAYITADKTGPSVEEKAYINMTLV